MLRTAASATRAAARGNLARQFQRRAVRFNSSASGNQGKKSSDMPWALAAAGVTGVGAVVIISSWKKGEKKDSHGKGHGNGNGEAPDPSVEATVPEAIARQQQALTHKVEEVKSDAQEKFEEAKKDVESRAESVQSQVDDKVKEVKDQAEDAQSKAQEYKQQAENKVSEFKDQAESKYSELKDQAESKYSELKSQAEGKASELKDKAGEKYNEAKEAVTPSSSSGSSDNGSAPDPSVEASVPQKAAEQESKKDN